MDISQEIDAVYQRALYLKQLTTVPPIQPDLVDVALNDLHYVIEELVASQEELRRQNLLLMSARQALEHERQRYHTLFDIAPVGYLVTDRAGVILVANQSAVHLFAKNSEDLLHKPLMVLIHESERLRFQTRLINLTWDQPSLPTKSMWNWDVSIALPDTQVRLVALSVTQIPTEPQTKDALLWLLRDITPGLR